MMRVRSDGRLLLATRRSGRSATIGVDFARDTADVTDRENIQYHWIRIEDVPEIWRRLDDGRPVQPRGLRRLAAAVPGLPRRRHRRRRDHRRHQRAGRDRAPRARQPGVLQPAAQVQDRADRAPEPRRLPRDQRRRPSSAPCTPSTAPASTCGSAAACRPTRCSPRRLGVWIPARRGGRRLGGRGLGLPRLRLPPAALAGPAEVPGRRLGRRRSSARCWRTSTSAARWSRCESPASPVGHRDHIGVHEQQDGRFYVGVAPTVGRVSGTLLVRLADLMRASTPSPAPASRRTRRSC